MCNNRQIEQNIQNILFLIFINRNDVFCSTVWCAKSFSFTALYLFRTWILLKVLVLYTVWSYNTESNISFLYTIKKTLAYIEWLKLYFSCTYLYTYICIWSVGTSWDMTSDMNSASKRKKVWPEVSKSLP